MAEWGPEWPLPSGRFDAGVFANIDYTRAALRLCDRTLVISHGIIEPEKPEGDLIAYTSEGVRDYWKGEGPIIRQPIDLTYWTPGDRQRTKLVRHSYRQGLDYLPKIAKAMGLEYVHCRHFHRDRVRDELQQAAVVVATGRAACEAMACGAKVVICDDRPYQGPLLDCDVPHAMTQNYSGRGGMRPDRKSLEAAIEGATTHLEHVQYNHDAMKVAEQILCLVS